MIGYDVPMLETRSSVSLWSGATMAELMFSSLKMYSGYSDE